MADQPYPTVRMVKFRLYTGKPGTNLYLLVRIFPTRRDMLAKLDDVSYPGPQLRTKAMGVMCTEGELRLVNGRYRGLPRIGTVNFCLPFLNVETVAHEFLHALFAWAERKGLRPQVKRRGDDVEDVLCYALALHSPIPGAGSGPGRVR